MEMEKLLTIVRNAVMLIKGVSVRPVDFVAVQEVLNWLNAVEANVAKQVEDAKAAAPVVTPEVVEAPKAE